MCDNFQNVGKQPLFKDRLNKFVTDGAILVAVSLSILAEIPSGPFAFDTSRVCRCCSTSSTAHSISSVCKCLSTGSRSSRSAKCKGDIEWLKHLGKKS